MSEDASNAEQEAAAAAAAAALVENTNNDEQETVRDPSRGQGLQPREDNVDDTLPPPRPTLEGGKEPAVKKSCDFDLRKLVRESDKFKWEIPQPLADHFLEHTRKHITDADMKLNLESLPVPSNVHGVPSMDANFKNILKKEGKNAAVDVDADWEVAQQRVQDVFGPLGKAWTTCALYKKEDLEEIDVYEIHDLIEMATLALAHAMQKMTWFRRVHALSGVGTIRNVKETLKEEKVQEILEADTSNDLVPMQFYEHLKATKGIRDAIQKHFKPPAEKKKGQSSTSTKSSDNNNTNRRMVSRKKEKPFSDFPSNRGGGYSNNDGYNNGYHNSNYNQKRFAGGRGGQGKSTNEPTHGQRALISRLAAFSQTGSSQSKIAIPNTGSKRPIGRENSKVLGQLENDYQRPSYSKHSQGLGNSTIGYPNTEKDSTLHPNEQAGGEGSRPGNREHADQGGNKGSDPKRGSIPKQFLCNPQERELSIPPYHQLERVEQLCPLPPFQNGRSEGREVPFEKRGLDVQNRSERRILRHSLRHTVTKTSAVSLERETLRVSMPSIWPGTSPKNLHKNDEGPNDASEKAGHTYSDLPRRYANNGILSGGGDQGKGYSLVPIVSPGLDNKHEKISPNPIPANGIFGSYCQQPNHELLSFQGKDPKIDFTVSRSTGKPSHDSQKPMFTDRKTLVHSGSSNSSSTKTPLSPTVMHKSPSSQNALRVIDMPVLGRNVGVKMVGRKPGSATGETHTSTSPRDDHLLRCSKDRGMGCSLPPWINGGSVVRIGKGIEHKHSGIISSRTSHKNIHQGSQTSLDTHENRQHRGSILHSQHGGDPKHAHVDNRKANLGLSSATQDHSYCRMDPLPLEHNSGLGIQKCVRLSRVETLPKNIPISVSTDGMARNRPIRIQDITSGEKLLQLESRSRLPSSGRISTRLEHSVPICISPILSNHTSTKTNGCTGRPKNDSHNTSMAITTMVSTSHVHVHSKPNTPALISKPITKSFQVNSPIVARLLSKAGGLASVRDRLEVAGVSGQATEIIVSSRREGTAQTYESAWKRWSVWCDRRGVDPIRCPINPILDYLAYLFHEGTPSKTIGTHRSAISAYHLPITVDSALTTTGRHPLVSALMSGINNLRPPQQRYSFTWDVELVLRLFRSWPLDLTPKQLTMKVTTLLALIGIPRGAELKLFDLNYMADYGDKYVFELVGTVKNVQGGEKPKPVEFHRHVEDTTLCPMSCIDRYISLTEPWRTQGNPSAFFLCHKSPHRPASKSTLARWIKDVLLLVDVDTKIFRAHSLRSASTSKALLKGLSVKEVVDHGRWSLESTWQRFYHKKVDSASKRYQDSILKL